MDEKPIGLATERRYILVELSDAKSLADAARSSAAASLAPIISRIDAETGADVEEIAGLLKKMPICHACVVEGQQQNCNSLDANRLGRRLNRLIDRANAHRSPIS